MESLLSLPFVHLASGVDAAERAGADACGTSTMITGYTEWVSTAEPRVSIGWDWSMRVVAAAVSWDRSGLPRSNILLVDDEGRDYPWPRNLAVLGTLADALPWKEVLPRAVALRYA